MMSSKDGGSTARRRSTYHAGLSPETVIDAAVELTRDSGLTGWSLRDLAKELGVAPSAIYHHVGGQELLSRHVVERVLARVDLPTTTMPWRQWFRRALFPARPVLAACPGTARWLLLHGPVLPSLTPVMDSGIASLLRAGFADSAALAFSSVVNTAMMIIAAADDRRQHEDDGPRDHETLMHDLSETISSSPGVSMLAHDLIAQFTGTPEEVSAAQDRYYRYVLERLMDGLEAELESSSLPM